MDNQTNQDFTPAVQPQPETTPTPQPVEQPAAPAAAQPAAPQPQAPTMRCPSCGGPAVAGRPFCGNCGAALPRPVAPAAPAAPYAAGTPNPNPYAAAPGAAPAYAMGMNGYPVQTAPQKKKSKKGVVLAILAVVILAVVALAVIANLKTPVESITLSETTLEMKVGDTETITYTIYPYDADYEGVTWSTSNSSVATVSAGTITAKGLGTCTISITAGKKTETITVNVVKLYAEETRVVGTWRGYAYLQDDDTVSINSSVTSLYLYSDGTGRMTISGSSALDFTWEFNKLDDGSYYYDVTYTSISGTTQMMNFTLDSGKECVAFKLGTMLVAYVK